MDEKALVMKFFTQRSKGTLVKMKQDQERLDKLLSLYLKHLPDVSVTLKGRDWVRWRCADWLDSLLENAKKPCFHCGSAAQCDYRCLACYLRLLKSFCSFCTETDKTRCQPMAKEQLKQGINPKGAKKLSGSSVNGYMAFVSFQDEAMQHYALACYSIPKFTAPGTSPNQQEVASRMSDFLVECGVIANTVNVKPGREHIEAGLSIISLHLALYRDFLSKRLFNNTPSNTENDGIGWMAPLIAYVMKSDGVPDDEIQREVNALYNPDELIVGAKKTTDTMLEFDSTETLMLLDGIQGLYGSRFIKGLRMNSIEDEYQVLIDKWVNKGALIRYPLEFDKNSVSVSPRFEHKHILYLAYSRLAALVSSVGELKLSAKSCKLFDNDGLLIKLRSELLTQRKSNEGRSLNNPYNLREACKKLELVYTTSRDAIMVYKQDNPAYVRLKPKEDKQGNFLAFLVAESTVAEIKQWIENVAIKAI
jgi:hypothetical protein